MPTLLNEGLVERAKLTNGVSTDPFDEFVLGSAAVGEAAARVLADMTVITTSGGERAAATTSYVADYQSRWSHLFSFTGTLNIYNMMIVNTGNKGLMWHEWPTPIIVHNGETAQITCTELEGRAA
jgi:hypothetical protein